MFDGTGVRGASHRGLPRRLRSNVSRIWMAFVKNRGNKNIDFAPLKFSGDSALQMRAMIIPEYETACSHLSSPHCHRQRCLQTRRIPYEIVTLAQALDLGLKPLRAE